MKKYFYILVCTLLLVAGISTQTFAATMWDVDGVYDGEIYEKIKIKKEGNYSDHGVGTLTVNATSMTEGDVVFDDGTGYPVSGTCNLKKGKKLIWTLDPMNIVNACMDWIEEIFGYDGVIFYSGTFYFFMPLVTKLKVDKRTGQPKGTAKVKLTGSFEADTNFGPMSRKFKYKIKMVFP